MYRHYRPLILILFIITSILAFGAFIIFQTGEKNYKEFSSEFPQDYRIVSPKVPANVEIFGEKVPLEDFDVYERLERELIVNTYWHSSTILNFKKANRWFPIIEPILEKYEVPDDFKYLAMIESNLSNAVSPAGAVGFWQFLKDTGRKYGLEVNDNIDERYHVEKATEAACKYLKEAYELFGSWTNAAASYNMGINGFQNQTERQKAKNYYNLTLNEETSRYVFRIIAARELHKNPGNFGFDIKDSELYPPFQFYKVKIETQVDDLADFAHNYKINYKLLKIFNPWLRDNFLQNRSGQTYYIKIPADGSVFVIPE